MKYLKHYKFFESESVKESKTEIMYLKYDKDVIDKCDAMIDDIKDILLELKDIGFWITVGYTPMTLVGREESPKIIAEIQSIHIPSLTTGKWISNGKDYTQEVYETIERLKDYVNSTGYPYGDGDWESTSSNKRIYQMLIQK